MSDANDPTPEGLPQSNDPSLEELAEGVKLGGPGDMPPPCGGCGGFWGLLSCPRAGARGYRSAARLRGLQKSRARCRRIGLRRFSRP